MEKETMHQERITSPEGISEYIRAVVPGMWIGMICVFLFLAAIIIWAVFGRIDTRVMAEGNCQAGQISLELPAEKAVDITVGNKVYAKGKEGRVTAVTDLKERKKVTIVFPEEEAGYFEMVIVTKSLAPISYLIG